MRRTWRGAAVLTAVLLAGAVGGCGRGGAPAANAAGAGVQPPHPAAASRPELPWRIKAAGTSRVGGAVCGQYQVPVLLAPPARTVPFPYWVWVRLCSTVRFAGQPVQLLVPGAGYDHRYYSWGSGQQNYVQAATAGRYVTAEVDMLGTGRSDHPAGALLDITTQAYVLHQLVEDLTGGLFGASFSHTILVGHSVGGYEAWTEAGTWHDVAGLVLLDAAHSRQPDWVAKIRAAQHDAGTDPRFAGLPWATTGYTAVAAGQRCGLYYWAPGTPPGTCAADENTFAATAIPTATLTSLTAALASDTPRRVTAPVLVAVGDHDRLLCPATCSAAGSPVRTECAAWYPQVPCGYAFEADAGHDTNLHRNAGQLYRRVLAWADQEVRP